MLKLKYNITSTCCGNIFFWIIYLFNLKFILFKINNIFNVRKMFKTNSFKLINNKQDIYMLIACILSLIFIIPIFSVYNNSINVVYADGHGGDLGNITMFSRISGMISNIIHPPVINPFWNKLVQPLPLQISPQDLIDAQTIKNQWILDVNNLNVNNDTTLTELMGPLVEPNINGNNDNNENNRVIEESNFEISSDISLDFNQLMYKTILSFSEESNRVVEFEGQLDNKTNIIFKSIGFCYNCPPMKIYGINCPLCFFCKI